MPYALLALYIVVLTLGYVLRGLNLRHLRLHGHLVPAGFEEAIDAATLAKTTDYTLEQSRLGLIESIIDSAIMIVFLFGGLLGWYDRWIGTLANSFVLKGLLFFLIMQLAQTLLDVPFSLYGTFRLEAKYGFNTTTPKIWFTDLLKSTLLGMALMGILIGGALFLVQASPRLWWLWVWVFFAVFTIFMMYISPYVIEPLFYKFQPVQEPGLEDEIRDLVHRAGLEASKVQQVDASRRSRHSNAYFTGIGHVKRIVLFDTIIQQMTHREILAVLAHEVGHWKKGHIFKRLIFTEVTALAASYLAFRLLEWGGLPGLVGLPDASFFGQLVILSFLGSLAGFPFTPFSAWLSRRHEWEADSFATRLTGDGEALATALIKLTRENLGNLHPHPLYAAFYYSHPPVVERVTRLRGTA